MAKEPKGKVESVEVKPTPEENEAYLQFILNRGFTLSDQYTKKADRINALRDFIEKDFEIVRKDA